MSGTYHVSAIARNLHAICSDILRRLKHTKIGFEFVLEKRNVVLAQFGFKTSDILFINEEHNDEKLSII